MKEIIKICASLLIIFSCLNCSNKISSIPADIEINDFVWKGMNAYYYWQSDVPNLGDRRFSNQSEINNFSASFATPEDIFEVPFLRNRLTYTWVICLLSWFPLRIVSLSLKRTLRATRRVTVSTE